MLFLEQEEDQTKHFGRIIVEPLIQTSLDLNYLSENVLRSDYVCALYNLGSVLRRPEHTQNAP